MKTAEAAGGFALDGSFGVAVDEGSVVFGGEEAAIDIVIDLAPKGQVLNGSFGTDGIKEVFVETRDFMSVAVKNAVVFHGNTGKVRRDRDIGVEEGGGIGFAAGHAEAE